MVEEEACEPQREKEGVHTTTREGVGGREFSVALKKQTLSASNDLCSRITYQ